MKYLLFLLWIIHIESVQGHGKLWEPPARSTMWRRGFNTPRNANDNELNCGGFQNHWITQAGRCGVCGDPYQQVPRPNEAGGTYGKGVISRHYRTNQIIDLAVDVTANHVGYFEFRVCPNNDIKKPVTQKCLDRYPVFVVGSKDGRFHVGGNQNGIVSMKGKLPKELVCTQCVLQWRYRTGNRWGCDKRSGSCGKGIGPQEEFYGCADVSITDHVSIKRMGMRKPVQMIDKMKSNFNLLSNPSELIDLIGAKTKLAPALDKLTSVLWTLLQTVVSTNRNSRVALVQWNPIGHDIVEMTKPNHLPLFNVKGKSKSNRPSSHWPPSKPTIVEADLGDPTGPMMLSELIVDEDWRRPTILKKYKPKTQNMKTDHVPVEPRCHATKEFEKVAGTSEWCSVNCNAGNCPTIMCTCDSRTTHVVMPQLTTYPVGNTRHSRNIQHISQNSISDVKESSRHEVAPVSAHNFLRLLSSNKNKAVPNKINIPKRKVIPSSAQMRCRGAGKFATHNNMIGWCLENCSKGFCPKTICVCSK